jgi:hypothetical protein
MILDLKNLSKKERKEVLVEAGPILRHIPFPDIHPDRSSSPFFYEIVIEEDYLDFARRKHVDC